MLGTNLTLFLGSPFPLPASPALVDALESAEVRVSEDADSAFSLTFSAGRNGIKDLLDYPAFRGLALSPGSRVGMLITMNGIPRFIFDGFVTEIKSVPGSQPGSGKIMVSGEDALYILKRVERNEARPRMTDGQFVRYLLLQYVSRGLIPAVQDPVPLAINDHSIRDTVAQYLRDLAAKHDFSFFARPVAPGSSSIYWGRRDLNPIPQKALTFNMQQFSNLQSIEFMDNRSDAITVKSKTQDGLLNLRLPVLSTPGLTIPNAARTPTFLNRRTVLLCDGSGERTPEAMARARARRSGLDKDLVTAQGVLDVTRYGGLLEARARVGVRGVGYTNDGTYVVRSVTHNIKRGSYTQSFELRREGTGALLPVVRVV